MPDRVLDPAAETKSRQSVHQAARQTSEQEEKDTLSLRRDLPAGLVSCSNDTVSSIKHASLLNRITIGQPSRAADSILQLQQQYGNHFVQRVVAQMKKTAGGAEVAPDVEESIQQARGGGQGLDSDIRAQMESAFGADFSGVRVHAGAQADVLNQAVNARAFTTGQDIFFRSGEYSPGGSEGRELLAHELTHVVQQSDEVRPKLMVSHPDDLDEQEADEVARLVLHGKKVSKSETDEEDESTDSAQRHIARRRDTSRTAPPSSEELERTWGKENPEGFVEEITPWQHYIIWNFDVASAELKPEHKTKLKWIASNFRFINSLGDAQIQLDGHASSSGRRSSNQQLSLRRAKTVQEYLAIEQIGAGSIRSQHYGSSNLARKDLTGRSMAYNRRVELRISRPGMIKGELPVIQKPPKGVTYENLPEVNRPLEESISIPEIVTPIAQGVTVASAAIHVGELVFHSLEAFGHLALILEGILLPIESMLAILEAKESGVKWGFVQGASYAILALVLGRPIPDPVHITGFGASDARKGWREAVDLFRDLPRRPNRTRKELEELANEIEKDPVLKVASYVYAGKLAPDNGLDLIYLELCKQLLEEKFLFVGGMGIYRRAVEYRLKWPGPELDRR